MRAMLISSVMLLMRNVYELLNEENWTRVFDSYSIQDQYAALNEVLPIEELH